jgi:hypothetical protein
VTATEFAKARDFLIVAQKGTIRNEFSDRTGFESIEDVEGRLSCLGKLAPMLNDLGDFEGRNLRLNKSVI